jgi:hypothetical protein
VRRTRLSSAFDLALDFAFGFGSVFASDFAFDLDPMATGAPPAFDLEVDFCF